MHGYRSKFHQPHIVLPVIHVRSVDQARRNAEIAHEATCEGIFLINHGLSFRELLKIHHTVFKDFPNWWIGVNCLDLTPIDVFGVVGPEVAGIWADNAAIDEATDDQPVAEKIAEARRNSGWQGLYFGGVAFKYQRRVANYAAAAEVAAKYMDVVTTSGTGTGQAAEEAKIHSMKCALRAFPLAIASGITPENVNRYLASADCFLVATGISQDFYDLDADRVKRLVNSVRSLNGDSASS